MKVVDAEGHVLGRLASVVAKRLLKGEVVRVVNAEKAIILGDPKEIVARYRARRRLNHPRKGPHYPRMPDGIVKRTVRGMLPYQEPRGRSALKRLRVYIGVPEDLRDAKMETLDDAIRAESEQFITVGDVARDLGASFGGGSR